MKDISKEIVIERPLDETFKKFINEVDSWWPKDYTWCSDPQASMSIDGRKGGKCLEIDPEGVKIEWGRIVDFKENEQMTILWMIGADREPFSEAEKASRLRLTFSKNHDDNTDIALSHYDFEKLGENAEQYRNALDSHDGWLHLLRSFKSHCQRHTPPDGTDL